MKEPIARERGGVSRSLWTSCPFCPPRHSSGTLLLPAVPRAWNLAWLPFLVRLVPTISLASPSLKSSAEWDSLWSFFFPPLASTNLHLILFGLRLFIGKSLRKTDEGQAYAIMKTFQTLQTSQGPSVGHHQEVYWGTAVSPHPLLHSLSAPAPHPKHLTQEWMLVAAQIWEVGMMVQVLRSPNLYLSQIVHISGEFEMNDLTSVKYFLHKGIIFRCFITGPKSVYTLCRRFKF